SVAQNQFLEVDFANLNPADPVIEGIVGTSNSGVGGARVELYNVAGKLQGWQLTNSGGYYAFRFSAPGTYTVKVIPPAGYSCDEPVASVQVDMFETKQVDFTLTRAGP